MNKKDNEFHEEELRRINGGNKFLFDHYGVWDKLTDEEKEKFIPQLGDIINFANKILELMEISKI